MFKPALLELVQSVPDSSDRILGSGVAELAAWEDDGGAAAASVSPGRRPDDLLATVAHELRAPLASIACAASALRKTTNRRPMSVALDMIDRSTRDMRRLIDDLSDTSAPGANGTTTRLESLDLFATLRDAVDSVQDEFDRRGHRLTAVPLGAPTTILGDPIRLQQLFVNLLSNAARHMDEGGSADLSVTVTSSNVLVRIRDAGHGIDAQDLPHLFDLYFRGIGSRQMPGRGIGLAVAAAVVAAHSGTISVSSEGRGKGSEFSVRLPRHLCPRRV